MKMLFNFIDDHDSTESSRVCGSVGEQRPPDQISNPSNSALVSVSDGRNMTLSTPLSLDHNSCIRQSERSFFKEQEGLQIAAKLALIFFSACLSSQCEFSLLQREVVVE